MEKTKKTPIITLTTTTEPGGGSLCGSLCIYIPVCLNPAHLSAGFQHTCMLESSIMLISLINNHTCKYA